MSLMASRRLSPHKNFLTQFMRSPVISKKLSRNEIAILCEICFNAHLIPMNKINFNRVMKHIALVRLIGKTRDETKARELLKKFASLFLPILIKSCCSNVKLY